MEQSPSRFSLSAIRRKTIPQIMGIILIVGAFDYMNSMKKKRKKEMSESG